MGYKLLYSWDTILYFAFVSFQNIFSSSLQGTDSVTHEIEGRHCGISDNESGDMRWQVSKWGVKGEVLIDNLARGNN